MDVGAGPLPVGLVTFLFTDIEDSTLLLRELGSEGYSAVLAEHRRMLRDAVAQHRGVEVDTQGDAFFIAFADAEAAIAAASLAQRGLRAGPVQVRMGLHTGTPLAGPEGYVGEDVHLGARIAAAGHGGQILISRQTREHISMDGSTITDLGEHRVKGFAQPVWIFQVGKEKFPPLRTISNTNLPRPSSSLVGRAAEVQQVASAIRSGGRLVTLTGAGGTGKTRLAVEAATLLVPDFKNGVFWVGLSSVSDPALVQQAIGEVLGAKGDLAEHIADRQMLLVLDNFEQVLGAGPEVSALLARCPALQMIVTSRALLRVAGEFDYAVPVLSDAEGMQLFCERSNLPADATIAELCRRLDNLPLAIELAAPRTRVMSPAQILDRLGQRLDMLKGGRDAAARQQTLRTTIAWSYDLLDPAEQELFARLSVFRGGCSLDAAEQVAGADVDVLQSLVEKSLVRHVGERFGMLETIHEFASERLADSGEGDRLARLHADFFAQLAAQADEQITGPDQNVWWQRLTDESENIRGALAWACAADSALALRLSALMWRYWWQRGHFEEGRRWYEAALLAGGEHSEVLRTPALSGLGSMLMGLGEIRRAVGIFEDCLEVFRREGDYARTVAALTDLGIGYTDEGDLTRARVAMEEALEMTRAAGDVRRTAVNLINLGDLALLQRDLPRAVELFDGAYKAMIEVGDSQSAGNALCNLGQAELLIGNLDGSAKSLRRGIQLARETDDRYSLVHSMVTVGALFAAMDDLALAGTTLGGVEALRGEMNIAINPTERRLFDDTLASLRTRLGASELESLFAEGEALGYDAALDVMLSALDQVGSASQSPGR